MIQPGPHDRVDQSQGRPEDAVLKITFPELLRSCSRNISSPCCGVSVTHAAPNDMKADELFRNVPASIHELYLALAGLPIDMEVIANSETGVSEKTVEELWARTTWPPGLVITTPRKLRQRSVLKISKAT